MKAAFFHDSKFVRRNGSYYSISGSCSNELWERYLDSFSTLYIVGREVFSGGGALSSANGVAFNLIDERSIRGPFLTTRARQGVTKMLKTVDVAIIRLPSSIGSYALKQCKKMGVPFFVELVGCPWDSLSNYSLKGKILAPFVYLKTKAQVRNSKFVLYVTNEFLQNRYPTNGFSIGVSDVIINENISYREKPVDSSIFKIGMLGGLDVKYKGYDVALKAARVVYDKNKEIRLFIAGSGSGEHIKKLIKKYHLQECVEIVGRLDGRTKVFNFLTNLDLFIQPSRQEGLPRTIVEAMSCGCPILGSDTGGIPELLHKDAIHKVGDFRKLAKDINSIIYNANTRGRLIEHSCRNVAYFKREILQQKRNVFLSKFLDSI